MIGTVVLGPCGVVLEGASPGVYIPVGDTEMATKKAGAKKKAAKKSSGAKRSTPSPRAFTPAPKPSAKKAARGARGVVSAESAKKRARGTPAVPQVLVPVGMSGRAAR